MKTENTTPELDPRESDMPSDPHFAPDASTATSTPAMSEERPNPFAPDEEDDRDNLEVHPYRSVCRSAVIAVLLTFLSLMAFTSPVLIFLPLASLVLGLMARSAIKRFPDELVGAKAATFAILGSLAITVGSFGFHTYVRLTEVPDGYQRISWGELQPDPSKPFAMLSEDAKKLDGEPVFIKGYVYPNEEQTNLRAFILVRDKGTCCFGGQPKPTDMIYVKLEGDLRVNYSWRQRNLGGIFRIDDVANRSVGKLQQIGLYRLTADHLK